MQMDLLGTKPRPSACEVDVIPLHHKPLMFMPMPSHIQHVTLFLWIAADSSSMTAYTTVSVSGVTGHETYVD